MFGMITGLASVGIITSTGSMVTGPRTSLTSTKVVARLAGSFGFQVHVGPAMQVQFKDIRMKHLPDNLPLRTSADTKIPPSAYGVRPQGTPKNGWIGSPLSRSEINQASSGSALGFPGVHRLRADRALRDRLVRISSGFERAVSIDSETILTFQRNLPECLFEKSDSVGCSATDHAAYSLIAIPFVILRIGAQETEDVFFGFSRLLNLLISGSDMRLERPLRNLVLRSNTRYGSLRMLKRCAVSLSINTGAGLVRVNQG